MRFVLGILIGFGIGFALAVLFAPESKGRRSPSEERGGPQPLPGDDRESDIMASLRRAMRALREQIDEAMEEAKKAAAEAEGEMRSRYEKAAGKQSR